MKGLCHNCHTSNVEISVVEGITICQECSKQKEA